jgi:hypothetical protein
VIEEQFTHLAGQVADLQRRQENQAHALQKALTEMGQRITAIPTPDPINYAVLAETVLAQVPTPEPVNYAALAETVIAQLPAQESINYVVLAQQLIPLLPTPPAGPDLAPIMEQIAALSEQVRQQESGRSVDRKVTRQRTGSEHESDAEVTPERTASEQDTDGESDALVNSSRRESDAVIVKLVNTKASPRTGRGAALKRAERIIKRHKNITPTELAERANISRSYASQLLAGRSA